MEMRLLTPEEIARLTPAERSAWLHVAATGLRALRLDELNPHPFAKMAIALFNALTPAQRVNATYLVENEEIALLDAIVAVTSESPAS